ncbi:MAG: bifunctional oligoribonuclease/PAP phosphatase NrnA [Alistipes sp.]|nr:bifunctional oligoribonuclease/PAP phosphatase NrnA [Alistipes sp.]
MNLSEENISLLRRLLEDERKHNVVIVSHTNPDGDALGSSLALRAMFVRCGHTARCIVPNKYPYFLDELCGIGEIITFKTREEEALKVVAEADVVVCADINTLSRLEQLSSAIREKESATRILVDHHPSPDNDFDIVFSHPESSSTAFLVYKIIETIFGTSFFDREVAEQLYVGMMTDTGNFSFSALTPELYRAVAVLAETGIDIPAIYNKVYNSFTEGRARLFGYVINRKMRSLRKGTVAYMTLTEEEMRRFWFRQGDSEGFVNYPLTIKKMKMSAIFIESTDYIRISFRSRGDVDVDTFARRYFNGGGHRNAAGGKSFIPMAETVSRFLQAVEEFAQEGGFRTPRLKSNENS